MESTKAASPMDQLTPEQRLSAANLKAAQDAARSELDLRMPMIIKQAEEAGERAAERKIESVRDRRQRLSTVNQYGTTAFLGTGALFFGISAGAAIYNAVKGRGDNEGQPEGGGGGGRGRR